MGWGGRWEGGSGWGIHVHPWLIHVNVCQKPLQYCKVINLQLKYINLKKCFDGKILSVGRDISICIPYHGCELILNSDGALPSAKHFRL